MSVTKGPWAKRRRLRRAPVAIAAGSSAGVCEDLSDAASGLRRIAATLRASGLDPRRAIEVRIDRAAAALDEIGDELARDPGRAS